MTGQVNNYNPHIDLRYIRSIAHADYVGARILWNLGVFMPSLQLAQESMEKYLKVLWAQDKSFQGQDDLENKLRKFGHNLGKVFEALKPGHQQQLKKKLKGRVLTLYLLEGLRYGTKTPAVGFSDHEFRSAELFILELRRMLGEEAGKTILADLSKGAWDIGYPKNIERDQILKRTLSLRLYNPTKKIRREALRNFKRYIARVEGVID